MQGLPTAVKKLALMGLCVALLLSLGCGKSRAKVNGKVLLGDKPVTAGTSVTFIGENNRSATAYTNAEGAYETADAPIGPVTVVIGPATILPGTKNPPKLVKIPAKYLKPESTPLKETLSSGSNEKTFTLEDDKKDDNK